MLYNYTELRNQILKRLEKELKSKRLTHTFGVETTAIALARMNHISDQDASIAALLHDIAKNLDKDRLEDLVKHSEYAAKLDPLQKYPHLLHAFAGAEIVQRDYPELPEDIVNAVRFHTTGRPFMGTLEKIIFAADYIEPGRKPFPGLEMAREMTFKDLDAGVLLILKQTDAYLHAQGESYHPLTRETYHYMLDIMEAKQNR